MSELVKGDQWVWVVIQDPGQNEQLLGQHDDEKNESFIPVFLEKEGARKGLNFLAHEKGHKYEIQAVLFEDLSHHAAENGFMLLVLKESGEILDKIRP